MSVFEQMAAVEEFPVPRAHNVFEQMAKVFERAARASDEAPLVLSVPEAARTLGVSEATVRRMVADGRLPRLDPAVFGRRLLIARRDIENLIERSRQW